MSPNGPIAVCIIRIHYCTMRKEALILGNKKEYAHHHLTEIILSKEEYEYQIASFCDWSNLLRLLMYGKELPDYEALLQKVSARLEVIGNFVYADENTGTAKAPAEFYQKRLFEACYEDYDETKERIEHICGFSVTEEDARKIYEKLRFLTDNFCPLLTDEEIWWAGSYSVLIEYAVLHEPCSTLPEEVEKEMFSAGFETSWRS